MELQGKPDFEESLCRIEAWFAGERLYRPPVRFSEHNSDFSAAHALAGRAPFSRAANSWLQGIGMNTMNSSWSSGRTLTRATQPWLVRWGLKWVLLCVSCSGAAAAGSIESIPANWPSNGQELVAIRRAEASSFLSDQYAPERICDGDRQHTKWVAPARPSASAPQWVTLFFARAPRTITGVAVFGERVDNDGIIDADIHVRIEGEFKTVASVRESKSATWLARFEPVATDQVRLLVLRSGGPTDHTDVWEVEVCGDPLSDTELRARLGEALGNLQRAAAVPGATARSEMFTPANLPMQLRAAWEQAADCGKDLSSRQSEWVAAGRLVLNRDLARVEEALATIEGLRARLAQQATGSSWRTELIARTQATGRGLAAPASARTDGLPEGTVLKNREVTALAGA